MLCNQLKKWRKLKAFSQEKMAKQMCMTQGQYSRLENGITKFTMERMLLAAKVLRIEVTEFMKND